MVTEEKLKDLIWRINTTDKMTSDLYHSYSVRKNISDSVSMIMYCLRLSDKPLTQSELCSMIYLSKQTINSALKKMKAQGYVDFRNANESRKSKLVSLTDKGIALAEETADELIKKELAALSAMPEQEAVDFVSLYAAYAACLRTEFLKN